MKLKNKKTGEIGNLVLNINPNRESYSVLSTKNGDTICGNLVLADYDTLAELNEEWEDYEEPKETIHITPPLAEDDNNILIEFERHKDAEKAAEKLKAWKRLKDKGFRITLRGCKGNAWLEADWGNLQGDYSDIRLLFGDEE